MPNRGVRYTASSPLAAQRKQEANAAGPRGKHEDATVVCEPGARPRAVGAGLCISETAQPAARGPTYGAGAWRGRAWAGRAAADAAAGDDSGFDADGASALCAAG